MKTITIILAILVVVLLIVDGLLFKTKQIPETAIQLASTITVLRPSFLTAQDIDNYLKGTPLYGIGEYVIEAEKESGIAADYLLAIIIHESGWGKGPWAVEPWHNLFSWGITDSGPNQEAYKIKDKMTREEAIIYVANQIKALYLTKGGSYYRGETLGAIGYYYASDGSWAAGVISNHNEFIATLSEEVQAKEWGMGSKIFNGDLPGPQYYTIDYWTRPITREELVRMLFRINER
jgi:hypothetical protein